MTTHFTVRIHYVNGSEQSESFTSACACYEYANNLSYSGGRIDRVVIAESGAGSRTLWSRHWTEESRRAGLKRPV